MVASSPRPVKPWQTKPQTPSLLDALAEQEERIAQRLRKLRADIGHATRPGEPLPVEEAAERAGVKYRQWQRWESGKTFPRSANLERVAERFEFDVAEFYESTSEKVPSQLDRIEDGIREILEVLKRWDAGVSEIPATAEEAAALARDAAPLEEAIESRARKARDGSQSRAAVAPRRRASSRPAA